MSPRYINDIKVDFMRQDSVESMLLTTSQHCGEDHSMSADDFTILRALAGNDVCSDCGKDDPDWASVNLGIFVCLECSGQHRSLGTHVSFVRSVKLDSWSPDQLAKMKVGGNQQCVQFLKLHGLHKDHTIRERYDSAPSILYQRILLARRDGIAEPTELPEYTPSHLLVRVSNQRREMAGFGSAANTSQPEKSTVLEAKKAFMAIFHKVTKKDQQPQQQ